MQLTWSALASVSENLWQFGLVYGLLVGGCGTAATFAPLMADISHWFEKGVPHAL